MPTHFIQNVARVLPGGQPRPHVQLIRQGGFAAVELRPEVQGVRLRVAIAVEEAAGDSWRSATPNSLPSRRPQGDVSGLLEAVEPAFGLSKLVLPPELERRLRRVLQEQKVFEPAGQTVRATGRRFAPDGRSDRPHNFCLLQGDPLR